MNILFFSVNLIRFFGFVSWVEETEQFRAKSTLENPAPLSFVDSSMSIYSIQGQALEVIGMSV